MCSCILFSANRCGGGHSILIVGYGIAEQLLFCSFEAFHCVLLTMQLCAAQQRTLTVDYSAVLSLAPNNFFCRNTIASFNSFLEGFNRVAELSLHAKGMFIVSDECNL